MSEIIKNNNEGIDIKVSLEKLNIDGALAGLENKSKEEVSFKSDEYLLSLNLNLIQEENPNITDDLVKFFNTNLNIA